MVLSHPRGHVAVMPEVEPRCPRSLVYMFKEEKDTANDYGGLSDILRVALVEHMAGDRIGLFSNRKNLLSPSRSS